MRPETCSACDQEVRHGWRDGVEGWWHRENVDHNPIFGRRVTRADWDRGMASAAARSAGKVTKGEAVVDDEKDPDAEVFVPHVEVPWVICEPEQMPGGATIVANLAAKHHFDTALWYARAHWKGKVISDMHRVEVAKGDLKAVAWWRDGKFESAVVNKTGRVNSDGLRAAIKEAP